MKKHRYFPVLLLAIFLLLCACAQNVTDQPETLPSSAQPSSNPTSKPTSTPTIIPTVVTQPTTKPATAPTVPTTAPTQPTTAPTKPTTPPYTRPLNLDWVTDREIVSFEDRFKEDVPFGYELTSWLVKDERYLSNAYKEYYIRRWSGYAYPCIIRDEGMESDLVYLVPIRNDQLNAATILSVDGRWGYYVIDSELCKLNLLTGELTTLAARSEGDLRWEVFACGKDTVCIFRLDAQRNLRVYYRDLHSDAERTLYQGVLPDVPTSEDWLIFRAPTATQGQAYWEMLNPAFYQLYLKELSDPNSTLKNAADLYKAVQDHYNIPMLVRYACDLSAGTPAEDFGLYDTCWNTKDCKHDHWNYENTREEIPVLPDVAPVEIPNFSKSIGEDQFWECDPKAFTYYFSDFGYSCGYWRQSTYIIKFADFPVAETDMTNEYFYCITLDGKVLQIDSHGTVCNTIYSSEKDLRNLLCHRGYGYVYFMDGNTIICIDEANGTWRPIFETTADGVTLSRQWDMLLVTVCQGMYYQTYQYNPKTHELTAVS